MTNCVQPSPSQESSSPHELIFVNDKHDLEVGYITCTPWKLYFDGSVCDDGQGIGVVLISSNGAVLEFSNRLEEECINNQVEALFVIYYMHSNLSTRCY